MPAWTELELGPDKDLDAVVAAVSGRYRVRPGSPRRGTAVLLDTFDWSLYNKSLVLRRTGRRNELLDLATGQLVAREQVPGRKSPGFWWEFPEGELRSGLRALISVRTLLPLVHVSVEQTTCRVLNQDDKTVVRLHLIENRAGGIEPIRVARLEALRGYDEDLSELAGILTEAGAARTSPGALRRLVRLADREPGRYTTRPRCGLDPSMAAGEAARRICRALLGVIQENEAGVKADLDREFLHDFRVSVRRTRSALSQIKGVFPRDALDRFRAGFQELGTLTNQLRDLDVYLLERSGYEAMLPEGLRPGLEALFAALEKRRRREFRTVVRGLESQEYRTLVRDWSRFLDSPEEESEETPKAAEPVAKLARRRIRRRHRRVLGLGAHITRISGQDMHQLRIECKKLRYLLEFFSELFPEKEAGLLIRHLKKLQDSLGKYNDLLVQQVFLGDFLDGGARRMAKSAGNDHDARLTAAALGGLITSLHREQAAVRESINGSFLEFQSAEPARAFRELFDSP